MYSNELFMGKEYIEKSPEASFYCIIKGVKGYFSIKQGRLTLRTCSYCDYSSPIATNMKRHIMSHTGERPFCCSICGQNFVRRDSLVAHMRVHSDERPHKCQICEKLFKTKGTLKSHMIVHLRD
ncbi:B lymphocyte-induced maturation protein 1 [Araneus ventricosus]|uniref:B lymphocyte-induced maturation protein 1 n=1 Tax=Araneus ventricosus TaxID=182803 RepID=A0A4Y2E3H3_ARAVE|nr:B lymphocyte-induced maturation protein 1 [Araneus ventricosus]